MNQLVAQLLVAALCLAGATGLGVTAVLREQARRRRFRDRMADVAAPYARVSKLARSGDTATSVSEPIERLIAMTAQVFGYNPARAASHPSRWWIVLAGTLVVAWLFGGVASILAGQWALFGIPVQWVLLTRFVYNWGERRRRKALYAQFPDALAMIVRAVRVGVPLGEGIRTVSREAAPPTKEEFSLLYDRVAIGVTLEDAMREMAGRNGLPEYRFFTTALALQSQTGGGLSEALEGLADVIRRRLALRARGNALAGEAKTSIVILASLPFVSGGALAVINPLYIGRLFYDSGCQKVLIVAIFMLTCGLLTMRGMIRKLLA